MGPTLDREADFHKVYRWMLGGYSLTCVGLMVYWAAVGDWYQLFQSLANLAMPGAFFLVYKALGLKGAYQLRAVVLAFTYLAYTLGVAACWYHVVPYYDKIMHTLSGALTMYLALPVFYWLKADKRVCATDCALALGFCLAAALAVAGIWEIAEYFINMATGIDLQNVAATGVGDTMQDMIVCLVGALMMLPPMLRYYRKGKVGFIMGAVLAFTKSNPGLYQQAL